ncbi:MAG: hypothetical protein OXD01_02850 [Gammaproteobacteria bacterium]|nr:hypothetical protein [Gammaproteobacteria bacterium]
MLQPLPDETPSLATDKLISPSPFTQILTIALSHRLERMVCSCCSMIKKQSEALLAVLLLTTMTSMTGYAAEMLNIEFKLDRDINIGKVRPVLKLAEFSDARDPGGTMLTAEYMLNRPFADIVRNAIAQGFASSDIDLVEEAEDMLIAGTVLSAESRMIESNGVPTFQITVRTRIELRKDKRTIWESTLFGRGTATMEEGITAAVIASLQRQVRDLFGDDYFRIELQ